MFVCGRKFLDIMTFCKHFEPSLIWALAWTWLLSYCQFCLEGCGLSSNPPKETWQTRWPKGWHECANMSNQKLPLGSHFLYHGLETNHSHSHISSSLVTDLTGGLPLKSSELNQGCTMARLFWAACKTKIPIWVFTTRRAMGQCFYNTVQVLLTSRMWPVSSYSVVRELKAITCKEVEHFATKRSEEEDCKPASTDINKC